MWLGFGNFRLPPTKPFFDNIDYWQISLFGFSKNIIPNNMIYSEGLLDLSPSLFGPTTISAQCLPPLVHCAFYSTTFGVTQSTREIGIFWRYILSLTRRLSWYFLELQKQTTRSGASTPRRVWHIRTPERPSDMRDPSNGHDGARRQESNDIVGSIGSDWGWFSDPLLEIPKPIYDSTAHVRGAQNARRELKRAGR